MVSEALQAAGRAVRQDPAPAAGRSEADGRWRKPRALSHRDVAVCVLLGLACFLIYNANLRSIGAVDTYAARYLPFSIWRNHTVVLDPIAESVAQGRAISASGGADAAWWIRKGREGSLISFYPIAVPVIIAPLYLPAINYLKRHDWDPLLLDHVARIMEKLSASVLAAASAMLLYFLMRRRSEPGSAALLTLVYALGTTTWVISSQALWMHGLGELLVVAALLLLTGPCGALRAATAGFLCALIACNRQPDAILAAGLGLYGLWWAGRMIPLFVAAAALPAGLLLAYNLELVGHIVGGYGLVSQARVSAFLNDNGLDGIAGLLFSPTRGLFVFSPFLLFLPFCLPSILRDRNARGLTVVTGCAVALQVVLYALGDWRQGASWGPRWLTDMLPILFWMLPPVLNRMSAAARVAFAFACVVAVAIEGVGAFWYIGVSDAAILAGDGPARMRAAWDIRNAPFIVELGHAPAPADLPVDLRGNIDAMAVRGDGAEKQLQIDGWALADSHSPAGVSIRVDGRPVGATSRFFTRPDVVHTLGEASPSGWRITAPVPELEPGEHVAAALVSVVPGSESRLLKQRTFTVDSPGTASPQP